MPRPLLPLIALLAPILAFADEGKLSGVVFGDFYSVGSHNAAPLKRDQAFWIRRFYLTWDQKLDANWSSQLRIEMKDPGDFDKAEALDPFVKDAWVRYTANGHKFTAGLIPTPTWGPAEEKLGYRPIEKTPLDLYRMGSARDKGVSVAGPLAGGKADYMLMVGDGSGTKSSVKGLSAVYGRLGYKATDHLYFDLYADSWNKGSGSRWNSMKLEAMSLCPQGKAGVAFSHQRRTKTGAATTTIRVASLYGEWNASDTLRPFARVDFVSDPIPDGDKIEYLKLSKTAAPTLFMLGLRYKLCSNMEIVPSVTWVTYRKGAGGVTPRSDTIARLSFSAKF